MTVEIADDDESEGSDAFLLALNNPSTNSALGEQKTTAVIIQESAGVIRFQDTSYDLNEADGTVDVTLIREQGSHGELSVDVQMVEHPWKQPLATEDQDYRFANGTVTFGEGELSQTLTLEIVDDGFDEPDEFATLQLGTVDGDGQLTDIQRVHVSIDDNDDPPIEASGYINEPDETTNEERFLDRVVLLDNGTLQVYLDDSETPIETVDIFDADTETVLNIDVLDLDMAQSSEIMALGGGGAEVGLEEGGNGPNPPPIPDRPDPVSVTCDHPGQYTVNRKPS